MAIIIEKAKAEDAEAILKLTKVFGSETDNLSFGESGIPVSVENEASYIASIENSDTDIFLVARDGKEIVGTGNYTSFPKKRMAHRGEFGISVRKSYWNQGVGTMLMEHILDFAKNVDWGLERIVRGIAYVAVPIFLMISGATAGIIYINQYGHSQYVYFKHIYYCSMIPLYWYIGSKWW